MIEGFITVDDKPELFQVLSNEVEHVSVDDDIVTKNTKAWNAASSVCINTVNTVRSNNYGSKQERL
jgi:hypothetical protein